MRRLAYLLLAAGLGLAGCANGPTGDHLIDYHSEGGFAGQGDGTALTVEINGAANATFANGTTRSFTLDRATLTTLRRQIDDIHFERLESHYRCSCADVFVDVVVVEQSGTPYAVKVDADLPTSAPAELTALLQSIKQITRP